jgi:hypothetical protein
MMPNLLSPGAGTSPARKGRTTPSETSKKPGSVSNGNEKATGLVTA